MDGEKDEARGTWKLCSPIGFVTVAEPCLAMDGSWMRDGWNLLQIVLAVGIQNISTIVIHSKYSLSSRLQQLQLMHYARSCAKKRFQKKDNCPSQRMYFYRWYSNLFSSNRTSNACVPQGALDPQKECVPHVE